MKLSIIRALSKLLFLQLIKPAYVLLFVTSRCEAKCGHCFYWKQKNSIKDELTLAEIEQLAKKCGSLVQLTLTGGSPELRDDLADITILFGKYCCPINITLCSNGNYPQKLCSDVEKILKALPTQSLTVDISLDGIGDEHDRIRGVPGLFDRVCESYEKLKTHRDKHDNLRLGCGMCVSGLNKNSAYATAMWAMEQLPIDNFTPILVRGKPHQVDAIDTDPDVFLKISELVSDRLRQSTLKGYAPFPCILNQKDIIQKKLIYDIFTKKVSPIRCSATRETATIYPDGTIAACELRPNILGNLRAVDMNISKIFKDPKTIQLRKNIAKEKCWCWHQCFLSPTIMKSPKLWLRYR